MLDLRLSHRRDKVKFMEMTDATNQAMSHPVANVAFITTTANNQGRNAMETTTNHTAHDRLITETVTLWACIDCYVLHVNGEMPTEDVWGDDHADRCREITDGFARYADGTLTAGRFHGHGMIKVCGVDHGDDHDGQTECETETFSWTPCDVCQSPLGGSRHAITYWHDTEDDTVTCMECGGPVDAGDGIAVDGIGAFCGGFYGNGCGEKY